MKIHIISLGFMNTKLIRASFARLYQTRNIGLPIASHVFVDQHYPINRIKEQAEIAEICAEHKIKILDPLKNLGLHDGFNWACKQLDLRAGDIVIAFDPDSYPLDNGWDMALARAILGSNGEVVWSSLMNPRSERDLLERGFQKKTIDGYIKLWLTNQAVVNSVCAFDWNWLQSVGGLAEPLQYYGLLESAMFPKLGSKKWAFVEGWSELDVLRDLHDEEYKKWKWCHAHLKSWPGDLETFIEAGCPVPSEPPQKMP